MCKIFKKSYFWFIAIIVITATILLGGFSGKVVYGAKYDCVQHQQAINTIIFHKHGIAEIYNNKSPYEHRQFVNYVIDGNNIYIYKQGETNYSSTLTINNKFNLKQTSPNSDIQIQCLNSIIAFGIIMAINLAGCIGLTVVTVRRIKYKKVNN